VHGLPVHRYMPQLFTHCLPAIICVVCMIWHLCFYVAVITFNEVIKILAASVRIYHT